MQLPEDGTAEHTTSNVMILVSAGTQAPTAEFTATHFIALHLFTTLGIQHA
jgi:hypothetical protein